MLTAPLKVASLSQALQQKLGYSLHVSPSGIPHQDAGDGLWLRGSAPVGAVVALYPGLVYTSMHYRWVCTALHTYAMSPPVGVVTG